MITKGTGTDWAKQMVNNGNSERGMLKLAHLHVPEFSRLSVNRCFVFGIACKRSRCR